MTMDRIRLGRDEYCDRMRGCWLGKNIGGTLGTPYEGQKFVHDLTYYDPIPEEPLPNDDLDFQLVWLKMLEDRGVDPTFRDFSDYWLKHLSGHWYSEYSFCTYNLKRGLRPPISGAFQNYFVDEMGSPIRSEIWACVAPGDPQLAATMAWMDSCMDHAGGEGTWGEMFWSAVESAAFVTSDPGVLIDIGLSMIPISSHISRCIREAVRCHRAGVRWDEARERIATTFGHHNACNAIPNHGFTVVGWLYGKDFGDKICKAVNCGYDTDCTGATLGSLLGIVHGAAELPSEWISPIGDAVVPVKFTVTEGLPKTVSELVNRTQVVAERFVSERSRAVEFASTTSLPSDPDSSLFANGGPRRLHGFVAQSTVVNVNDLQVIFHYGGEPVLQPNVSRVFEVSLRRRWEPAAANVAELELAVPEGWIMGEAKVGLDRYSFEVSPGRVEDSNIVRLRVRSNEVVEEVPLVILGPGAVRPIPASTSAPRA